MRLAAAMGDIMGHTIMFLQFITASDLFPKKWSEAVQHAARACVNAAGLPWA